MIAALLKGIALGLMLSISVGPVIFSILKQSINNGLKGGFVFIAGVAASDLVIVVASNFATDFFSNLLTYKTAIGIGGSILLAALGIYITFFKRVSVNEDGAQVILLQRRDYIKIFLSGFFMNTLNPSVIGFWLLTSTTLLVESSQYRFTVFATCLIIVASFDVAKVLLAGRIRQKLTPHNIHIINRISGLILIGFGIALLAGILAFGPQ
jgi:threonine/homoserine/homoserine lactone efflux protein